LVDISKENFAIHLGLYAYYEAFSLNLLSIEEFIQSLIIQVMFFSSSILPLFDLNFFIFKFYSKKYSFKTFYE